jgi:hypothetical protein
MPTPCDPIESDSPSENGADSASTFPLKESALQASIDDMRAGRVVPAETMLAEMRQLLAEKQ